MSAERRESQLLEDNNLGKFYRFCNSKLNSKTNVGAIKLQNGQTTCDPQIKADTINNYFSSTFSSDNGSISAPLATSDLSDSLSNSDTDNVTKPRCHKVDFNSHVVLHSLRKLAHKTSCGPDQIPAIFLKKQAIQLAYPLAELFTKSFQDGFIPDLWKFAHVTPIFKKGNSTDPANYRAISLTCIISKVMESIIKTSLMSYLLSNKIITKQQHGFLAKHSTTSNILECLHDWNLSHSILQNNKILRTLTLHVPDSVVHSKLLFKLRSYGITGNLYNWITEFLSNRSQCTVVENKFSSIKSVDSGVIQGSCLGPVLFILFINDIDSITTNSSHCKLYADDLKLYSNYSDCDPAGSLQTTLNNLYQWSIKWQLNINFTECHILHLGTKNPMLDYDINGFKLSSERIVTDLGVQVDSNLRFNNHINSICSKAYSRIRMLFRGFVSRNPELLVKAYKIYVLPLL